MSAAVTDCTDLLDAALAYAAKGWPVFPCNPQTKRPLTEHGLHDASADADAIRSWWRQHPRAMIGCPTGPVIGAWALDVDDPAAFAGACEGLGLVLPATARCDTGKGYHLYFAWDDEAPVHNRQRHATRGWPFPELPGAETRGAGGYVILPPSPHPSGRTYAWARDEEPSEAPDELLAIVRRAKATPEGEPRKDSIERPAPNSPLVTRDTPYGLAALNRECDAVRSAPNGSQEGTLVGAALKAGGLVAGGELMLDTAREALRAAGLSMPSYDPRNPWTAEGVTGKIEAKLIDGAREPRSAPPRRDDQMPPAKAPVPIGNPWPVLDLVLCATHKAPERQWHIEGWVPSFKATLMAGDGGVGKSLLAQLMATCVALGIPFMGTETRQAVAAYASWEDDMDELWRRQEAICASIGVRMADLAGKLHLLSYTEEPSPFLIASDPERGVAPTPLGTALEQEVARRRVGFLVLDNASQIAGIDHNAVEDVAPFAHWLGTLAKRGNGAVVLLHHTNKAGQDYLGSVAYNNQFRARMLLARPGNCYDPDIRLLTNPKANYARAGSTIEMRWHSGAFVRDEDLPANVREEINAVARDYGDDAIFLACLAERTRQQLAVSEKVSSTYAPKVFADLPDSKRIGKERLEAAMQRLFRRGEIERALLPWQRDRKEVFGLRQTCADGAPTCADACADGAQTGCADAPDLSAPTAHNTHPYTTYKGGAALEAAPPPSRSQANAWHSNPALGRTRDLSRPVFGPTDDRGEWSTGWGGDDD